MQYNIRGDAEGLRKQGARRLPEEGLQTPVEVVTILANLKTEDGELANGLATDGVYFYVQFCSLLRSRPDRRPDEQGAPKMIGGLLFEEMT